MLLLEARKIKKNNDIDFAFQDVTCSLGFRCENGSFRYSNSESEIHNLINKLVIISTLASTKMVNVFALMIVFLCFQWLMKDKLLILLFCLTSYFYFLSIVCLQHTFNSIYIIRSSKPTIYPCQYVINWCTQKSLIQRKIIFIPCIFFLKLGPI